MKKIIALTLIIGSLTFAGLILFNTPSLPQQKNLAPILESAAKNQTEQIATEAKPPKNSTNQLAETIAKELLKEKNPSGLKPVDPEKIINEVFKNGITNFDVSIINPDIKMADLKISSDNSEAAIKNYALNFKKILARYAPTGRPQNYDASLEDLKILLGFYTNSLPELYQIDVPPQLAQLHREGLKVFQAEKNVLEKLVNSNNDPVGAILVMEMLPILDIQLTEFINGKINKL